MQLEKEPILTLVKNKEENIAGEFLSSDLIKNLEEYDYLLADVSNKKESLNNTVFYLNYTFVVLVLSSLMFSLSTGGFKYLALVSLTFFILSLCNKESILRKWSDTKQMQSIWSFVVKGKILNKDIAFSKLVNKTKDITNDLGQQKNKALIAKLYKEFSRPGSQIVLKNTFAKMMTSYNKGDNQEILMELMKVFESVKKIMNLKNDDFMADDIAAEFIDQERKEAIKERNIFKKKENYRI